MISQLESHTNEIVLVSGPSSSGKSELAEYLLQGLDNVAYIATADNQPNDKYWQGKILEHRNRRPLNWVIYENYDSIINTIEKIDSNYSILIDSIGGFVSRHINSNRKDWEEIEASFVETINSKNTNFSIVIEETGWSVVPTTRIGNIFRTRLGSIARKLELISDQSWLVIQGRAINLKIISTSIPK